MATTAVSSLAVQAAAEARARVRRLRRAAGFLLNLAGIQVILGVAWDSTWHYSVGRDAFLYVPSHMLLYTATALAAIVCLALTAAETVGHRGGAGVTDDDSIALAGVRLPLGIAVSGFGVLTIFVAAPLDDYWHTLYGAFLHVSSPFHMMDVIGGTIFFLGIMYLWGALAVAAAREGDTVGHRRAEWGMLIAAMLVLRLTMALSNPGLSVYQTVTVAGVRVMTYPVIFALLNTWMLLAVAGSVRLPYPATAVALLLMLSEVAIQAFVPWAVRAQAAFEGREFLSPALVPYFSLLRSAPQVVVLAGAGVVDHLRRHARTRRWAAALVGVAVAVPLWAGGSIFPLHPQVRALLPFLPRGIDVGPLASPVDALVALPLALGAGALSAMLGHGLGRVLRLNPR